MLALAIAAALQATTVQLPCPSPPLVAPGLEGWAVPAGATKTLPLDHRVEVALLPTSQVRYALPPEKPGSAAQRGVVIRFIAPSAGKYRIALSAAAWIDVVGSRKVVTSTGHTHGPACTGMRKIVDFTLAPGPHLLQISGAEAKMIGVMIAPAR